MLVADESNFDDDSYHHEYDHQTPVVELELGEAGEHHRTDRHENSHQHLHREDAVDLSDEAQTVVHFKALVVAPVVVQGAMFVVRRLALRVALVARVLGWVFLVGHVCSNSFCNLIKVFY